MNSEIIEKAANEFGTPFYVFESDRFVRNYLELDRAYKDQYSKFQIAYSFKTNYMPAVCKKVLALNGWAEVVSDMEYALAKQYGFSPDHIIVNGPGKWNGMEEMITDGALLMLDNEFELKRAAAIAQQYHVSARIGFRLNMDIGTNKNSRFGFDVCAPDTKEAIVLARNNPNFRIMGLHFHLGGARSLEAWKARAKQMIHYAQFLLQDSERLIIDLGSGMFGHLHPILAEQFHQQIPSFQEYAEIVAGAFADSFGNLPAEMRPTLVVEPGATLIADSMVYATKTIAVKKIRNRSIAMVDGSVHQLGELGKKKRLPVGVLHQRNDVKRYSNVDVTGYTCLEDDILYPNLDQEIGVGDIVWFQNAGAYTNVMKPPFIQVGCKIIQCDQDGNLTVVKREENIGDILSSYHLD